MRQLISADELRALLSYDPLTGIFRWRVPVKGRKVNSIAGTPKIGDGRNLIMLNKKRYIAARLAWLYMTGSWPENEIDHKDTDPKNDSWENRRDVPHRVNMQNVRRVSRANQHSTLLGAIFQAKENRWSARIRVNGRTISLGRFDTEEAASAAYVAAKRKMHEGCTL